MSEKKETVPELAGLSRNTLDTSGEYFVPDYVMRDFGDPEEATSSSSGAFSGRSSADFLL